MCVHWELEMRERRWELRRREKMERWEWTSEQERDRKGTNEGNGEKGKKRDSSIHVHVGCAVLWCLWDFPYYSAAHVVCATLLLYMCVWCCMEWNGIVCTYSSICACGSLLEANKEKNYGKAISITVDCLKTKPHPLPHSPLFLHKTSHELLQTNVI